MSLMVNWFISYFMFMYLLKRWLWGEKDGWVIMNGELESKQWSPYSHKKLAESNEETTKITSSKLSNCIQVIQTERRFVQCSLAMNCVAPSNYRLLVWVFIYARMPGWTALNQLSASKTFLQAHLCFINNNILSSNSQHFSFLQNLIAFFRHVIMYICITAWAALSSIFVL